jgi:hypothetical protein
MKRRNDLPSRLELLPAELRLKIYSYLGFPVAGPLRYVREDWDLFHKGRAHKVEALAAISLPTRERTDFREHFFFMYHAVIKRKPESSPHEDEVGYRQPKIHSKLIATNSFFANELHPIIYSQAQLACHSCHLQHQIAARFKFWRFIHAINIDNAPPNCIGSTEIDVKRGLLRALRSACVFCHRFRALNSTCQLKSLSCRSHTRHLGPPKTCRVDLWRFEKCSNSTSISQTLPSVSRR